MGKAKSGAVGPFVSLFAYVSLVGFVRLVAGVHDTRANMVAIWMLIVCASAIDTNTEEDFMRAFVGINSLSAGILLPLLLDEVHSMHDAEYYMVRGFGTTSYVPFMVLSALIVSSMVSEGKGFMARISVVVATIASALFFCRPPPLSNISLALLATYFCKAVVMAATLRSSWSLTVFETSLLMSLAGYGVNYVQTLTDIPRGGDIYSHHNSMHFFILAALIMLDVASLVTVTSNLREKKGSTVVGAAAAIVLVVDIPLLFTLLPMAVLDAFSWLFAFIHTDGNAHLKTAGVWMLLIIFVQLLADHVTQPKLTILEVPQERMDSEGNLQTIMVDVTYADFEKTKMSRISSRKLFHFLMVSILGPVLAKGGTHVQSFCTLALGGMLVLLVALEMIRSSGYLWPLETRPKWLLNMTCYFDRFTGQKKRWGNEITIMGRKYDPAIDETQRLTVAAQKSWSLTKDHFSLLLGCGIPVWFYSSFGHSSSSNLQSSVLPLMGCICVGLGDALSAIVGSNYGRVKWSPCENDRTVEGSLAGFVGSLVMAACVMYCESGGLSKSKLLAATVSMAGATVLEAFADVNDNLLLAMYSTSLYAALLLWFQ